MSKHVSQRVFQDGLVYVFSAKKYIKDCRFEGTRKGAKYNTWIKNANGQKVIVNSPTLGIAGVFTVCVEWCKCIGRA